MNLRVEIEVLEPLLLMSASCMEAEPVAPDAVDGAGDADVGCVFPEDSAAAGADAVDWANDAASAECRETGRAWFGGGDRADYTIESQGYGIYAVRCGTRVDFVSDVKEIEFRDGAYDIEKLAETQRDADADVATNSERTVSWESPNPDDCDVDDDEDLSRDDDDSGSDKSGSDKSGSDKSGSDKSGSDKSGSDKSGSDKSGSDKSRSDKSGSDKSGRDDSRDENRRRKSPRRFAAKRRGPRSARPPVVIQNPRPNTSPDAQDDSYSTGGRAKEPWQDDVRENIRLTDDEVSPIRLQVNENESKVFDFDTNHSAGNGDVWIPVSDNSLDAIASDGAGDDAADVASGCEEPNSAFRPEFFRKLSRSGIFRFSGGTIYALDPGVQELSFAERPVDDGVNYSVGGEDAHLFQIDAETGELCFVNPPDYECPLDADGDNVYQITIERDIDGESVCQTVQIAVCDIEPEATAVVGSSVSGNVLVNDSDPDCDDLTASLVSYPCNGSVVLTADGEFDYVPNEGFCGIDVFTYQVEDGNGGCDIARVCIEVLPPPNSDPDAVDDYAETTTGVPVCGSVADNDNDPDGDCLTWSLVEGAWNGCVALSEDGSWTYTPNAGFTGTDCFTYQVEDGNGGCDVATVSIEVECPPNEDPEAADDEFTTTENESVTGNVVDNDTDPDGDDLTAVTMTDVRTTEGGTVTLYLDGSFVYDPAPGFCGTDTFRYEVTDNNGGCSAATVKIQVTPVPCLPEQIEEEVSPVVVRCNIIEPVRANPSSDDTCGTVTVVQEPTNGNATLKPDGTFRYEPDDPTCPEDQFSYAVETEGASGDETDASVVSVDVEYDTSYAGSGTGLIWGDPHFIGDDGGLYDVQGEAGHVYSLLSDHGLQLNARFVHWLGQPADGTVIGELGVTVGSDQIHVDFDGPQVNGAPVQVGQPVATDNGGSVEYDGYVTTVTTAEYQLHFIKEMGLFSVRITVLDPFSDNIAPHGLWGQTVDADTDARNGDYYTDNNDFGLQGGGAIETAAADGTVARTERGDVTSFRLYETEDLFGTTALNADGAAFFRFAAAEGTGLQQI